MFVHYDGPSSARVASSLSVADAIKLSISLCLSFSGKISWTVGRVKRKRTSLKMFCEMLTTIKM